MATETMHLCLSVVWILGGGALTPVASMPVYELYAGWVEQQSTLLKIECYNSTPPYYIPLEGCYRVFFLPSLGAVGEKNKQFSPLVAYLHSLLCSHTLDKGTKVLVKYDQGSI